MILYHATPRKFLHSILTEGLDPQRSNGRIKGVWLHTASKRAWAVLHTQRRHKTQDVVVLKVKVCRSHLTRRWRGLWSCAVPIIKFEAVIDADQIAQSPIEESQ